MGQSMPFTDRKPEATMRKDWVSEQANLPLIGEAPTPHLACPSFVGVASWAGALRYAVQRSGRDDYEIADELAISHGYISRVMRGTANLSGDKLVRLMQETQSLAPLQWLADQMGFELRPKQSEKDALRARLAQLEAEERRAA